MHDLLGDLGRPHPENGRVHRVALQRRGSPACRGLLTGFLADRSERPMWTPTPPTWTTSPASWASGPWPRSPSRWRTGRMLAGGDVGRGVSGPGAAGPGGVRTASHVLLVCNRLRPQALATLRWRGRYVGDRGQERRSGPCHLPTVLQLQQSLVRHRQHPLYRCPPKLTPADG